MQAYVVAGGQGELAAHLAGKVSQCAAAVVHGEEDTLGAGQQQVACLGEGDFSPDTVEKPRAQQLFEGGNAFTHRWLRKVKLLGGPGKALGLRHGKKGLQALGIHGGSLVIYSCLESKV